MKQGVVIFIVAILFIVAVGTAWYFLPFSRLGSAPQNINPPPPDTALPPPPVASLPEPPEGYMILKNNNPTMRAEIRSTQTKKFTEIIERLKTEPDNSLLWIDLGSIKYAFEDFVGAEAAFKYAIQINPLADFAYVQLAAMYQYKTHNYPEAEKALRAVIDLDGRTKLIAYADLFDLYRYRYTAKAHLAEGVMLEAYREFPTQHAILKTLAWYHLEQKNEQKAIEYFEKFLEKVPNDVSAKEELEFLKK